MNENYDDELARLRKTQAELRGIRAEQMQQLKYILDLGTQLERLYNLVGDLQRDLYQWLMQSGQY